MINISFNLFRSKTYDMDKLINQLSKCNFNLDYLIINSNKIEVHSSLTFFEIDTSKLKKEECKACMPNYEVRNISNYSFEWSMINVTTGSHREVKDKLKYDNFLKYKNKIVKNYNILSVKDKIQFEYDYAETVIRLLKLITTVNYKDFKGECRTVATEIVKLINDSFEIKNKVEAEFIMDDLKFELEYLRKINDK